MLKKNLLKMVQINFIFLTSKRWYCSLTKEYKASQGKKAEARANPRVHPPGDANPTGRSFLDPQCFTMPTLFI